MDGQIKGYVSDIQVPDLLKTCGFIKIQVNGAHKYGLFYFCIYTKRLKLFVLDGAKYNPIDYVEGIQFMTFDKDVGESDRRMIIYSIINDPSIQDEIIEDNELIVYDSSSKDVVPQPTLVNLEPSRQDQSNRTTVAIPLPIKTKVELMIPINLNGKADAYLRHYMDELVETSKALITKDNRGKAKVELDINRLVWALNQILPSSIPMLPQGSYEGKIIARDLCIYSKDGRNYLVDC
jgi:hypothetical protein